jgi:hypothetical protein
MLPLVIACGGKKKINARVSLSRNDKIPYGCWYAYNELQHIFPDADLRVSKVSPDRYRKYRGDDLGSVRERITTLFETRKSLYMIVQTSVLPDVEEIEAMLSLAGSGKHIFISTMQLSEALQDSLRIKTAYNHSAFNFYDTLKVMVQVPGAGDSEIYTYPGKAMDNYLVELDSNITTILGKDGYGRPNFVRFDYVGGGAIYIHLAPLALTNYFLLHKRNKTYYDNVLSHLPEDMELVQWDDYFRYHEQGSARNSSGRRNFSPLQWISNQPGLGTAFWLVLLLFLVIYLFESKRRQRIIPEIPPLKNASLDFVKTIGRLYYQSRDNRNLAYKMTAHFLDHVRSKYNIRVSINDSEFEKILAWKTGVDPRQISDLVNHIKMVQQQYKVGDEELMELNTKLENFYKAKA